MLVLSRKKNQSIVIDGGIEIQVLQLKGGTVKIGISAPDNVRIIRGELDMFSDMVTAEDPKGQQPAGVQDEVDAEPIVAGHITADHVSEPSCEYFVNSPLGSRVMAK